MSYNNKKTFFLINNTVTPRRVRAYSRSYSRAYSHPLTHYRTRKTVHSLPSYVWKLIDHKVYLKKRRALL